MYSCQPHLFWPIFWGLILFISSMMNFSLQQFCLEIFKTNVDCSCWYSQLNTTQDDDSDFPKRLESSGKITFSRRKAVEIDRKRKQYFRPFPTGKNSGLVGDTRKSENFLREILLGWNRRNFPEPNASLPYWSTLEMVNYHDLNNLKMQFFYLKIHR